MGVAARWRLGENILLSNRASDGEELEGFETRPRGHAIRTSIRHLAAGAAVDLDVGEREPDPGSMADRRLHGFQISSNTRSMPELGGG
jgi:hypothetical protein